jgi:hypothetical protein
VWALGGLSSRTADRDQDREHAVGKQTNSIGTRLSRGHEYLPTSPSTSRGRGQFDGVPDPDRARREQPTHRSWDWMVHADAGCRDSGLRENPFPASATTPSTERIGNRRPGAMCIATTCTSESLRTCEPCRQMTASAQVRGRPRFSHGTKKSPGPTSEDAVCGFAVAKVSVVSGVTTVN